MSSTKVDSYNNLLIQDFVLTKSSGFVKEYNIIETWREKQDGQDVYYVKISAYVSTDYLKTAMSAAGIEIPHDGKEQYRKFEDIIQNKGDEEKIVANYLTNLINQNVSIFDYQI